MSRALFIACTLLVLAVAPAAAENLKCPRGAKAEGHGPPQGLKHWCVKGDGVQHGPSLLYYPNTVKMAEANFKNGKLDGVYREWHPNGQIASEGTYKADEKNGPFTLYDAEGKKRSLEQFQNGVKQGEFRSWWPNGQLGRVSTFVNGKRSGTAISYFENGQKQAEGQFKNGQYHGTWRSWYDDGSKEKVAVFEDGRETSREYFPRK